MSILVGNQPHGEIGIQLSVQFTFYFYKQMNNYFSSIKAKWNFQAFATFFLSTTRKRNNTNWDSLPQDHQDLCEFQLSQHQLIYDMYNTISLTEIKGYAMMQFSWMLLRIYGKGQFHG